jgi:hypothetical protein
MRKEINGNSIKYTGSGFEYDFDVSDSNFIDINIKLDTRIVYPNGTERQTSQDLIDYLDSKL